MRRAARVDANHAAVVDALVAAGCLVQSTAAVGNGFPDLVVWSPYHACIVLLEVKDGSKKPSARKLTQAEQSFHTRWQVTGVHVVHDVDEALRAVCATRGAR